MKVAGASSIVSWCEVGSTVRAVSPATPRTQTRGVPRVGRVRETLPRAPGRPRRNRLRSAPSLTRRTCGRRRERTRQRGSLRARERGPSCSIHSHRVVRLKIKKFKLRDFSSLSVRVPALSVTTSGWTPRTVVRVYPSPSVDRNSSREQSEAATTGTSAITTPTKVHEHPLARLHFFQLPFFFSQRDTSPPQATGPPHTPNPTQSHRQKLFMIRV